MRAGVKVLIPLLGVLTALLLPASSQAAVTIGSDLSATPDTPIGCNDCTRSNVTGFPGRIASGGFIAPSDGIVVRWRIKSGATVSPVAFRILRPGSSTTRIGAGSGPTITPTVDSVTTTGERLPIKAGDVVGIDQLTTGGVNYALDGSPGAPRLLQWGAGSTLPNSGSPQAGQDIGPFELLINADIEPDVDGDGYGDETQDLCPQRADLQVACPQLTVEVVGHGFVSGAGIACPGDCTERYPTGTQVSLDAFDGQGAKFDGFTGKCAGASPCPLTLTSDGTATATFVEDDPPETTITKKPKKSGTKKNLAVGFSSDEPNSTFECKLDSGDYKPCLSPYRLRVNLGRHTFTVRAIDSAGNVDETPAFTNFRVKKPKKR